MANETPKTVIAEDIEITGSIKSAKNIQFDGKLNGDMVCNGTAIIGQGASIKGNITVDSVTVLGQINGNLTAKDRIELKSAARINGDIKAKRLTVEDGVTFIGKSEVNPGASQPISQTIAPTPEYKSGEPERTPAAQSQKDDAKAAGFFGRRWQNLLAATGTEAEDWTWQIATMNSWRLTVLRRCSPFDTLVAGLAVKLRQKSRRRENRLNKPSRCKGSRSKLRKESRAGLRAPSCPIAMKSHATNAITAFP